MSIKQKLEEGMKKYLESTLLPHCYNVAVRHGFVGDLEDFSKEVLSSMKGEEYSPVQECSFYVATSSEEAQ